MEKQPSVGSAGTEGHPAQTASGQGEGLQTLHREDDNLKQISKDSLQILLQETLQSKLASAEKVIY